MEGWTEEEMKDKNLMAPCGLYCGACGVYIATRDRNEKFKAVMGNLYGTKPEDTECCGCMQSEPPQKLYGYCTLCAIRNCVRAKGYYSCHQCGQWPCSLVENFGLATGVRVMKRAIPLWRAKVAELGDEKGSVEWALAELERYHCPACGKPLFRGAKRCRACKKEVAEILDGTLLGEIPRTIRSVWREIPLSKGTFSRAQDCRPTPCNCLTAASARVSPPLSAPVED